LNNPHRKRWSFSLGARQRQLRPTALLLPLLAGGGWERVLCRRSQIKSAATLPHPPLHAGKGVLRSQLRESVCSAITYDGRRAVVTGYAQGVRLCSSTSKLVAAPDGIGQLF